MFLRKINISPFKKPVKLTYIKKNIPVHPGVQRNIYQVPAPEALDEIIVTVFTRSGFLIVII